MEQELVVLVVQGLGLVHMGLDQVELLMDLVALEQVGMGLVLLGLDWVV